MKLVLHAPNVHRGGGRTLLHALLGALPDGLDAILVADRRLDLPAAIPRPLGVVAVPPTVVSRLAAEWRLRAIAAPDDVVLCLGNLPPLLRLRARVRLFLQNRLLCEPLPLRDFPVRARARIAIERYWLRACRGNVDDVIVQSPSMQASVERLLGVSASVLPFAEAVHGFVRNGGQGDRRVREPAGTRFLYVASGEPHKNHERLIEAWELLAASGVHPALHLTLPAAESRSLHARIAAAQARGAAIVNHGNLDRAGVDALYRDADALIHPSTVESLGLPLIEARQASLPVVAAELDYVRDVVDPEETFDPHSATSIARAVRRFLGVVEPPLPLLDPADFLRRVIAR